MDKEKLVLFGGAGFIGCNLIKEWHEKFDIIVADLKRPLIGSCKWQYVDIRGRGDVAAFLRKAQPDFIIHLAACSTVRDCFTNPRLAFDTNVIGTVNILQGIMSPGMKPLKRLIVHSSDKAYGDHPIEMLPYKEDLGFRSFDIYSTSKSCQDLLSLSWQKRFNLPIITVRSGNIYGPFDFNPTRLIPNTITRVLNGKPPIIHANQFDAVRDFVYITDLARAYEILLRQGKNGEAYNIGGSGPTSIINVVELIKNLLKATDLKNQFVKNDLIEYKAQYLSNAKIEDLGFITRFSLLAGLKKTIAFHKRLQQELPKRAGWKL